MNSIAQSSWRIERYWKLWWWKHRKHNPMGTKFCGQGPASLQTGGKGGVQAHRVGWHGWHRWHGIMQWLAGLPRVSFNWKVLIDFDAVWSRPSRQQKAACSSLVEYGRCQRLPYRRWSWNALSFRAAPAKRQPRSRSVWTVGPPSCSYYPSQVPGKWASILHFKDERDED